MTDGEWKKGRGGAVMIKVIVVDDERFVRMGIVGETDWASLGCEVVGEAENGVDALELSLIHISCAEDGRYGKEKKEVPCWGIEEG